MKRAASGGGSHWTKAYGRRLRERPPPSAILAQSRPLHGPHHRMAPDSVKLRQSGVSRERGRAEEESDVPPSCSILRDYLGSFARATWFSVN